ncbi:MAG: hypothetical protein LBE85_08095 [Candidatus Accumulibacter sp.]|jgi:hypothetical protein|nr:hypothetical protein [Accumulibacter sp.]
MDASVARAEGFVGVLPQGRQHRSAKSGSIVIDVTDWASQSLLNIAGRLERVNRSFAGRIREERVDFPDGGQVERRRSRMNRNAGQDVRAACLAIP